MSLPYEMKLVEDENEGGFVAYYPDLQGCVSYGKTKQEAITNVVDTKSLA